MNLLVSVLTYKPDSHLAEGVWITTRLNKICSCNYILSAFEYFNGIITISLKEKSLPIAGKITYASDLSDKQHVSNLSLGHARKFSTDHNNYLFPSERTALLTGLFVGLAFTFLYAFSLLKVTNG